MSKDTSNTNYKCRTCLNGSKGFQLLTKMIIENKEETKSYGEFLKDITHIDIMNETYAEMSQSLCGLCIRKLKSSYSFVQQAKEVHEKLWTMINEEGGNVDESKTNDCLQEAQIDIQNCLKIKIEEAETLEICGKALLIPKLETIENQEVTMIGIKDKTKVNPGKEDDTESSDPNDVLETTNVEQNDLISDDEDDENSNDLFHKPDKLTGSDDESMSSKDSDWIKETDSEKRKENKIKNNNTFRTKKERQTIIDDNIPTPCDQCDRVFPNSRLLSRHKRHTHVPEELKVQCPYCQARFGRRHNMYAHMRTHHKDKPIEEHITQQRKFPRQYACEQCDGTYTSKYYLLAHMKLKHDPDGAPKKPERVILPKKRFLCTLCGSKFDTQSNLDVHIRRHTGEKPYKCDLCDRAFYRPCDVQAHRRSHTGEKPFICKVCEKAFARSNKLKIHMRTHSNERPYKCDQCEKAFKHSKDLNIHKRIHTGERPYTCGVCHSTFTQSNSLKLHQTKQQHFDTIDQVLSC